MSFASSSRHTLRTLRQVSFSWRAYSSSLLRPSSSSLTRALAPSSSSSFTLARRSISTTPHVLSSASQPKEQSSGQEELILSADDNNFDAVIDVANHAPVLVDFYANWCGPCRAISPILAKVAKEKGIRLVKVDVDEAQAVASKYNIASLPTVSLFRDGKPVDQFLGMRNEAFIRSFIDTHDSSSSSSSS